MRKFAVCVALAAVIGIAYYNALGNGFVFDDYLLVVEHPAIPKVAADPELALSPSVVGYRPLRTLSYVIDYRLGGLQPWIFHLSNVVYHWLTACLVFLVTLRLTNIVPGRRQVSRGVAEASGWRWRVALLTALFWALHPVQTDAVTYIAGRRDILGGLCLFLGLWAYLRFRAAEHSFYVKYLWLAVSCVVYVLGILSKESVLVLPALCWLADVQREGVWESLRRRWALYFLVLLSGAVVLWHFAGSMIRAAILSEWHGGGIEGNFATVARIWVHYLSLMVFPKTLIGDYSYDAFPASRSFLEPEVLAALGVLGVVVAGLWALARWRPLIGYGALWLLVTILPTSHIIPIREVVAEHYLYVPLFGFCLIAGVVLDAACGLDFASEALPSRVRAAFVYGLVAVLLAGATARVMTRNRDWVDEETFWTVTVRDAPRCARARYNLAGVYARQKRRIDAAREFAATMAIAPNHVDALAGLGEMAFEAGLYGQALGYATQARAISSRNFRVEYLLGYVFFALQKFDEAEAHFRRALQLNPSFPGTRAALKAVAKARKDSKKEES